jgi:hypothetical protein
MNVGSEMLPCLIISEYGGSNTHYGKILREAVLFH